MASRDNLDSLRKGDNCSWEPQFLGVPSLPFSQAMFNSDCCHWKDFQTASIFQLYSFNYRVHLDFFFQTGFLLVFCGVTRIFRSSHISICYGSQTRSNGTVEIRNCLELTDLFVCIIKVGITLFLFCISENSRFRKGRVKKGKVIF